MAWINYHHLYYFYRIAETGSVSKAAVELRIGQPTLSTQLKELEANLGELFDRKSRSLVLNERGRLVLKYSRDIFSRGDELLGVLERGQLALQREIVFGAQEGVPKAIISQTVARVQRKTKLKIRVVMGEAPVLIDELLSGRVDMLGLDHEISHSGGTIVYIPLGQEKIAFWGTKEYQQLKDDFPNSLSGKPLVLSCVGHPLRQVVEKFFIENGLNLSILVEAPDTALVKELALSGVGIVALGQSTVKAWLQAGKLHKIGALPYVQKYSLGFTKKFLEDPLSELILKEFKA